MNRSRHLAALAVAAALTASCGGGQAEASPSPTPAPTTASPTPAVDPAECSNVERAYNAWKGHHSHVGTVAEVEALNEYTAQWTVDAGKEFINAITGYQDKPAQALVVAVAEYNVDITFLSLTLRIGSGTQLGEGLPRKVADDVAEVDRAFDRFMTVSCARL